jgi:hypothetical protein
MWPLRSNLFCWPTLSGTYLLKMYNAPTSLYSLQIGSYDKQYEIKIVVAP